MTLRVKTEIMIAAYIRKCQAEGAFAVIARKGDVDAGVVAIKVYASNQQACAFIETRDYDGDVAWRALTDGLQQEAEVDAQLAREMKFDQDLWLVEVEDRDGRHFLNETILPKM